MAIGINEPGLGLMEGGYGDLIMMIRLFLLLEGIAFIAAALTHFGVLIHGYEHQKAGTAESVIGIVLLISCALTWVRPKSIRGIGIGVQAFALFGTLVGIFTIAVGVGPRTAPDIAYHLVMVMVLVSGLIVALRRRTEKSRQRP